MHRDMQKILLHWGGWVVQGRVNIGWKSVSAGFENAVTYSGNNKLSCSDEDGMIIDSCVAKLRNVGMAQECDFIEHHYVSGMSKRAIGRKFKLGESEVRKRMLVAESFILGCLEALDEPLEIDLIYGFHGNRANSSSSALNAQQ
ncbi:antiterminator Q family protein [Xenorhabdus japonica]|uniref:Phage antitermination protein Q n=1 Tax=Xenorhabdus japonica TaxID=53341 RepID=A0A1I5AXI9_9GAMM|nr:antiterminator Q family protein [Xenorhabdus japonica]SFN67164.1 Phage antitermination protein Q [Xenorhabdus japonica]